MKVIIFTLLQHKRFKCWKLRHSIQPYKCLLFLDDAECELNCKPVGLNYFATLNDRVKDGTSCFKPSEFLKLRRNHAGKAICVDGICKVS